MIKIGKFIYYILSGDTIISGYVGNNIYPMIAPENTSTPIIIYERRGNPTYNKDSNGIFFTDVDFTIITDKYNDGIEISQRLFNLLNGYRGEYDGMVIHDVNLTDYDEVISDNYLYIQRVSFNIKSI